MLVAFACVHLLLANTQDKQSPSGKSFINSIDVVAALNAPDENTYWMQARAAVLPRDPKADRSAAPPTIITMQKTDRVGTHMYHGLEAIWSSDLGKSWKGPDALKEVDRITHKDGLLEAPVDMTPQYHKKSGKLLVTGATFWQDPKLHKDIPQGPSHTAYAVYDPVTRQWDTWKKLAMPDEAKYHYARAGCTQRIDLPDGDILLPIYYHPKGSDTSYVTVARCTFDGTTLKFVKRGNEVTVDDRPGLKRKGLHEPSLTEFKGKYYLTLRNDERGYVATSDDGLQFDKPQSWKFDDDAELGSYNTQQHWVTHSDRLFLSYTRRGANNDKVFRHRAPLFIAQVDPENLVVKRSTEQILLPNMGEAFGNFGVCNVSANETWVVDCLRFAGAGKPSVYVAKIRWSQPNRLVSE